MRLCQAMTRTPVREYTAQRAERPRARMGSKMAHCFNLNATCCRRWTAAEAACLPLLAGNDTCASCGLGVRVSRSADAWRARRCFGAATRIRSVRSPGAIALAAYQSRGNWPKLLISAQPESARLWKARSTHMASRWGSFLRRWRQFPSVWHSPITFASSQH